MKKVFTKTNRGQAIIGMVLLFAFVSSTITIGLAHAIYLKFKSIIDFAQSQSSYYLAESLVEDTAYRMTKGISVSLNPTMTIDGETASATITDVAGGKEIVAVGDWSDLFRKVKLSLGYSSGGAFFYGIQVGAGGLHMYNSSSVVGNIHSDGPIVGTGNVIKGDVISADSAGLIDSIHATSSAHAHTIKNSTVDRDAYYTTISNTTVGGTSYPGSSDPATSTLPISDSQIDDWETDALYGGTLACTGGSYDIIAATTIGPAMIPCDLTISGNEAVNIAGALWVKGNVSIGNNPIIRVSDSRSGFTVPIIADNPTNRDTSSKITISNSPIFQGTGNNSYILLVSNNTSAENGGSENAIVTQNSATGDLLLYAPHGNISLENNIGLKEVTAYKLTLKNSSQVTYETGLADILFSSGPSGGFSITEWKEIK